MKQSGRLAAEEPLILEEFEVKKKSDSLERGICASSYQHRFELEYQSIYIYTYN